MIPQTPQIAMSAKKENDVMGLCLRERIRHSIFLCLALVTMFSMFLLTTVTVQANTVTINDQAGVRTQGGYGLRRHSYLTLCSSTPQTRSPGIRMR
jgi:hypothetical protein